MTPVERATATAEAQDRTLPLIIGQTGGECDSGLHTRGFLSRALRDRLHPNDSVGWFADILKFGADRNLERTMMCSQDTGELPVEYTLQIRTEAELKHWLDHDLYTPVTAPKDSTPIPEPTPTPRPTPGPSPHTNSEPYACEAVQGLRGNIGIQGTLVRDGVEGMQPVARRILLLRARGNDLRREERHRKARRTRRVYQMQV